MLAAVTVNCCSGDSLFMNLGTSGEALEVTGKSQVVVTGLGIDGGTEQMIVSTVTLSNNQNCEIWNLQAATAAATESGKSFRLRRFARSA